MSKVWSLVQNVTKDWTSFQNVTKKASKIRPKFGHFFPKKLPKVRSLFGNILTRRERERKGQGKSLTRNCTPLTHHVVSQELCNTPAVGDHVEGLDILSAVWVAGHLLAACQGGHAQQDVCHSESCWCARSRCWAETCAEGHLARRPLVRDHQGIHCYAKIGTCVIAEDTLMVLLPILNATEWVWVER